MVNPEIEQAVDNLGLSIQRLRQATETTEAHIRSQVERETIAVLMDLAEVVLLLVKISATRGH